jgi:hypothetical protein
MARLHHYTRFYTASYKNILSQKKAEFFYNSKFLWFQMKEFCGCVYGLTWFTLYPMITVLGILVDAYNRAPLSSNVSSARTILSAVASSVTKNLLFKIWSLVDVLFMSNSQQEVSVLHFAYIYDR